MTMTPEQIIRIKTVKTLLEHQQQVRKDRRDTFESWDKNSAALIAQYEKELADAEKGD